MSLFEGVPVDDVAAALAGLERRRFSAGSTVLVEGDYPGELYLVESGTADVFAAGRDGTEHHLALVGPRTTLGEMSLFTGLPQERSAPELTCRWWSFPRRRWSA